jgi:hypothetical protein
VAGEWPLPVGPLPFRQLGAALAGSVKAWPRRWAWISAVALVLLWGVAASDAATAWIKEAVPKLKTDPTAEAISWTRLRTELTERGLIKPGTFVVATEWSEAGKIDQAVGEDMPVLVFNADPREYAFRTPSSAYLHHDALIIGRPTTVQQEVKSIAPHFARLSAPAVVSVGRGDKAEIPVVIVVAHDLVSPYPLPAWAK